LLLPNLKNALFTTVAESVNSEIPIAVAFSGGLDSTLLAKICKDLGFKVTLLTVGLSRSPDLEFSKEIASKIGLRHNVFQLNEEHFHKVLSYVRYKTRCENVSHIENCIAYFYIASLASKIGLQLVFTANGCDELFCGYNNYRLIYDQGRMRIIQLMDEKIANELILMKEIETVTSETGVNIGAPFLTEKFISFAKSISINRKISGPNDLIRKHILRETALSLGVPRESAMKPKKALQYSTRIDKKFKIITKKHNIEESCS
jgi:asparagine synthase (glutamine-hydrolysing)